MHLDCRGEGEPAVVLEAGLMSGSSTWLFVHDRLAAITRTCAYDRPRMDWSGDGDFDPHVEGVALRLHNLLQAGAISGPIIIVGMSAGGVYVREYTARFPENVTAMVLVDSSHEQQIARLPPSGEVERLETLLAVCSVLQPLGFIRLMHALDDLLAQLPAEHAALFKAMYYKTGSCAAVAAESKSFTADLKRNLQPRSLGDLPLLVISQGKPPAANEALGITLEDAQAFKEVWETLQTELTHLSRRGERIVAEQSGHVIQLEQPEIVIEGITDMLARVRELESGTAAQGDVSEAVTTHTP